MLVCLCCKATVLVVAQQEERRAQHLLARRQAPPQQVQSILANWCTLEHHLCGAQTIAYGSSQLAVTLVSLIGYAACSRVEARRRLDTAGIEEWLQASICASMQLIC